MRKPFFGLSRFKITGVAGFILIIFLGMAPLLFAGGHFGGTFDPDLGITIKIYQEGSSAEVPSMNFGTLLETASGGGRVLRGNVGFVVFIYPQVNYIYQIYCTGSDLTNGDGYKLPAGACVVTPVYAPGDNNGNAPPPGSSAGSPGSWVTSAHRVIYTDSNGEYRAIQAHFAIREDIPGATQAVPIAQPSGTYTGTVVFTIIDI